MGITTRRFSAVGSITDKANNMAWTTPGHWQSHRVNGRTSQRYSWRPGRGPRISATGMPPRTRKGWAGFISNLAKQPDPMRLDNATQSKNLIGQALRSKNFGDLAARGMLYEGVGSNNMAQYLQVHISLTGHSALGAYFEKLDKELTKTAIAESWGAASWIFKRSQQIVPYNIGQLHDSGYIREHETGTPGVWWEVGYDTASCEYAWAVHENTNHAVFQQGKNPYPDEQDPKQDHFLSDPAEDMSLHYKDTVAEAIDALIKQRWAVGAPRLVKR